MAMVYKLTPQRIASQASEAPKTALEIAIVKLLVDAGFHHKRIAALYDCNQGRIAEISCGKVGSRVSYKLKVDVEPK